MVVRSFHASTLSLVLIHATGITKQHLFALFQQAFEQLVREEHQLDTQYPVGANDLSDYFVSDSAHGALTLHTNSVFSEGHVDLLFVTILRLALEKGLVRVWGCVYLRC